MSASDLSLLDHPHSSILDPVAVEWRANDVVEVLLVDGCVVAASDPGVLDASYVFTAIKNRLGCGDVPVTLRIRCGETQPARVL